MPSDLDTEQNFPDALSDALDEIRRSIHGSTKEGGLNTRSYRVEVVTRQWSEGRVGGGTATSRRLELDPRPLVSRVPRDRLGPGGREAAGDVVLTEVSLSYSAQDLNPDPLPPGCEVAYRVIDDSGQQQPDQWYVVDGAPVPRRGDRVGDGHDWRVHLRETSPMSDFDGAAT